MFKVPKSVNVNFLYERNDEDIKIAINDAIYDPNKVILKIEKGKLHNVQQEFLIGSCF